MMQFAAAGYRGRCLRLVGVISAVWGAAMLPASLWYGVAGVEAASLSALACLIPGCLVFRLLDGLSPSEVQVRAVIAGTGLRIVFGLLAALVMHEGLSLAPKNYVVWLTVFYLAALLVETSLILPARKPTQAG